MTLKIAITQRQIENDTYKESRDALSQDWVVFADSFSPDSILLPIPNRIKSPSRWLETIQPDLIILSNGEDWGTSRYRDKLEEKIISFAASMNIPILFVCRGFQTLNEIYGNKITSSIKKVIDEKHVAVQHKVQLTHPSFINIAGKETIFTNSYHDRGVLVEDVRQEGELIAFAQTPEGVLEGCFHQSLPFLAIEWHPERPGSDAEFDKKIISKLIDEGKFWS